MRTDEARRTAAAACGIPRRSRAVREVGAGKRLEERRGRHVSVGCFEVGIGHVVEDEVVIVAVARFAAGSVVAWALVVA